MPPVPRDDSFDASLAFLRQGYDFFARRYRCLNSDIFRTRLMLRPVTCMRGREAAAFFYGGERFTRVGAMPFTTLMLLQDLGSVQSLDGVAHRQRKRLFLDLLTPQAVDRLTDIFAAEWRRALPRWERQGRIRLQDEMVVMLTAAVCAWAGLRLAPAELARRAHEFGAMVDYAGGIGPRNWWAQLLRQRCELWARRIIADIRAGRAALAPDAPAAQIAAWRDEAGALLPVRTAAVELLNILRPTVAVSRFIVFAAHALHVYPQWRDTFAAGIDDDLEPFAQEVRRHYPFFPAIAGRARQHCAWRDVGFQHGDWVILDLHGTDHDPSLWPKPTAFRPERFRDWRNDPYSFVPQGGGLVEQSHRCPGEGVAVALIMAAVRLLTRGMRYRVPPQDLTIRPSRMPALPESGFIMTEIAALAT